MNILKEKKVMLIDIICVNEIVMMFCMQGLVDVMNILFPLHILFN